MIDIKVEGFFDCLPELQTLFYSHWQSLGAFKDKMPLSPNWKMYAALETLGELLCVVARINKKIVGYYIARVGPCLHYSSTISAQMDIMWVDDKVRNHGIGIKIFQFVENELKNRGTQIWYSNSKIIGPHHNSMDKLLKWMNFTPVDMYYGKWIGN
jgi:GNAT superfamily N-acetyltransferase